MFEVYKYCYDMVNFRPCFRYQSENCPSIILVPRYRYPCLQNGRIFFSLKPSLRLPSSAALGQPSSLQPSKTGQLRPSVTSSDHPAWLISDHREQLARVGIVWSEVHLASQLGQHWGRQGLMVTSSR